MIGVIKIVSDLMRLPVSNTPNIDSGEAGGVAADAAEIVAADTEKE